MLVNYFWLLLFTAACLSAYLIDLSKWPIAEFNFPFSEQLHINLPFGKTPIVQWSIAFVLIFLQGVMISSMVIQNRMSRALSIIPGGVMVLFLSWSLYQAETLEVLFANLFFIVAFQFLFSLYKKYRPIASTFNAGFFLGLSVIVYPPYQIFVIVALLGHFSLRGFNLKELLQLILAFFCPLFLLGVALFNKNELSSLWPYILPDFTLPQFDAENLNSNIILGLAVLIIIYLVLLHPHIIKKKKFDVIKKIKLSYWVMFFALLSLFLNSNQYSSHLIVLSFPFAIISGLYLEEKDNSVTKEFVFIILFGLYMAFHFSLI